MKMNALPRELIGLVILMFALVCVTGQAAAEDPLKTADALVKTMTERLLLMEDVARYKWNNKLAIEDLERERVVLDKVVTSAEDHGVPVGFASDFFQAQIVAAKAIQSRLFEAWRQGRVGSFPDVPDLQTELRPAIGALTGRMIEALAQLDAADGEALCASTSPIPQPLAQDIVAWRVAVAPLRERKKGC